MMIALLADAGAWMQENTLLLVLGAIVLLIGIFFMIVFFSFLRLWIQSLLAGAGVGIFDMVRMKLLKVDYAMIVRQKIALVQAGVKVSTQDLEDHFLSRGNVPKVATAVIAAHKAGMDLPLANRRRHRPGRPRHLRSRARRASIRR